MSTLLTRLLGGVNIYDRQSVRVDASAFAGKSGILCVNFDSLTTPPTGGNVDVRAPNYDADHDPIMVLANSVVAGKVYIAYNNGVPGPSVRVNQDGTWDLLDLVYTVPAVNTITPAQITFTYDVSNTDLTPATGNPSTGNTVLNLAVGGTTGKTKDKAALNIGTPSGNGYIKAWINQIVSTIVPNGTVSPIAIFQIGAGSGEGCGCGGETTSPPPMIRHAVSPTQGTKVYSQGQMVFAINGGKIDKNGNTFKGVSSQTIAMTCKLEAPTDNVALAVTVNVSFASMA